MKILSIETSCDETAISLVEASGELTPSFSVQFNVLGNVLVSQIDIHKEYGGVFPMLAKREHAKNLSQILKIVFEEAHIYKLGTQYSEEKWSEIEKILEREDGLFEKFKESFEKVDRPDIDVIGVTAGPGLAPALWVGISFAKALSILWDIPVIPVNHMEGHILSVLIHSTDERKVLFPALSLLISGGHTELVQINSWGKYKVIGETKDDATGEAFDKVARLLGLPYPGGPEVSKLALKARTENIEKKAKFPRPMIHSENLDFSFSGLKTAVLYYIRDLTNDGEKELSQTDKIDIAREFEDTVVDVLVNKTKRALSENEVKTLIIAGGVIANKKIAEEFLKLEKEFGIEVKIPTKELSTDNSLMIAGATYINSLLYPNYRNTSWEIKAYPNVKLGQVLK